MPISYPGQSHQLTRLVSNKANRRNLKTSVAGIGDKTADYYGVLVCDPQAVAIDERINIFLSNAGIPERNYSYKQKKLIVQSAAGIQGYTPLDLEQSIWHSNPKRNNVTIPMNQGRIEKSISSNLQIKHEPILSLPKYSFFKGIIQPASGKDKEYWSRRDINFIFNSFRAYPHEKDHITLIDTECEVYESVFTKAWQPYDVTLGKPSRLKKWYIKNYDYCIIYEDNVYFEYTGVGDIFWIYTSKQWPSRRR